LSDLEQPRKVPEAATLDKGAARAVLPPRGARFWRDLL
jgi:hypothetical protein